MKSLLTSIRPWIARVSYGEQLDPARDWLLLLSAATILLALSILINVWIYIKKDTVPIPSTAPTVELPTTSLTHAAQLFHMRMLEEANYRSVYQFIDPSK